MVTDQGEEEGQAGIEVTPLGVIVCVYLMVSDYTHSRQPLDCQPCVDILPAAF